MQSPWQLYLFSALQLLGFFMSSTLIGRDPCHAVYNEPCNNEEAVMSNLNSMLLLTLAVYFSLLTYLNQSSPEKLKRLAYFAIYCTISTVTGVLLMGSTSVAGLMKPAYHATSVAITLVLFFILATAVSSDTPMVPTSPFFDQLGFNLKGLMSLYTLLCLVWIFLNSDVAPTTSTFQNELTELAKMCYNYFSVLVLQVLFVYIYALAYEDDGDRQAIAIASVVLGLLGMLMWWSLSDMMQATSTLNTVFYTQSSIVIVLAIAAVVRYRMSGSRRGSSSEYQPISNA